MGFNKDHRIFEKYFEPISDRFSRDTKSINEIVIHGTMGGRTNTGMKNWMLSGERKDEYKRGVALFHDLIGLKGEVDLIIPYHYFVYHSSSGRHDKITIGIELINPDKNNEDEYTDEQYNSLFSLIEYIREEVSPVEVITSHGANKLKYSGKYRNCPGNFDWERLQKHFNLVKLEHERYVWTG